MKTEFTVKAKTLEEAYAKAHDIYSSLGDLKIEIITQGKKGFLGFGRVDAEIKVIVDDGKEEKRSEQPKNQPQGKAKNQDKHKNSNQALLKRSRLQKIRLTRARLTSLRRLRLNQRRLSRTRSRKAKRLIPRLRRRTSISLPRKRHSL